MHPLLRLLADRPQLLVEHADAYASLIAAEVPRISAAWRHSALLYALALSCLLVGLMLAGVAAMLWAVAPALPLGAPWVLMAVPALPLLAGLACFASARSGRADEAIDHLREQVRADIAMLREGAAA
jgi:uncharacterized membrane protein YqjE